MKLHFKSLGDGEPIFILHGVFGSADNWITIGKQLAQKSKVYLIDQRNHGQSPHDTLFNYEVMAEDLFQLMKDEHLAHATIIGHSMGGKTAMEFACKYPSKVDNLVVVDIGPKAYPPHHHDVLAGFHAVKLEGLQSRNDADRQMSECISNPGVRQFLLKNLNRTSDGFSWKHNLEVIEKNIEEIGKPLDPQKHYAGKTLFIRGSNSDYIKNDDIELIKNHFQNSRLETVENAGHWVHAEQPVALLEILNQFL
ncbi:MAG: alpha/beta fold hydrolase [Cyclobacteriaceae bacterium]